MILWKIVIAWIRTACALAAPATIRRALGPLHRTIRHDIASVERRWMMAAPSFAYARTPPLGAPSDYDARDDPRSRDRHSCIHH